MSAKHSIQIVILFLLTGAAAFSEVLFDADFEGCAVGTDNVTVSNLTAGTSVGSWVVSDPEESDIVSNGSNTMLFADLGTYIIRGDLSSPAVLSNGLVIVEYDFIFRRAGSGRDHLWIFVDQSSNQGVFLEARDTGNNPGRWQLHYIDGAGSNTLLSADMNTTGVDNPASSELDRIRLELSENSFDVLFNGTLVGDDLTYNSASFESLSRVNLLGVNAASGGHYDNLRVEQQSFGVPELIGITSVSNNLLGVMFQASSEGLSGYTLQERASLVAGAWEAVAFSDDGSNPFVVSNLSYSTFWEKAIMSAMCRVQTMSGSTGLASKLFI